MSEGSTQDELSPDAAPPSAAAGAAEEVPFDSYWRLRMDGATSRLSAVQEIVTHNASRGTFAEALLREVIAEFLPQRYAAATGFIMDKPRRSNQVDILIYDQLTDSPVFRDGGFVVLSPGTAKLAIEVKSNLTGGTEKSEIRTALDNIRSAKAVDPKVRGFVFGFGGSGSSTFVGHVKKWGLEGDSVARTLWPDRVFNLAERFAMSPTPGALTGGGRLKADSKHGIYADATVVRSFLTAALQATNLANLRAFLTADPIGEPSDVF